MGVEKQGYEVELDDDLNKGVLTTHDAIVVIYKNECNKWVVSPLLFTNLSSVVTITTVKAVENGAVSETTVHALCASNVSVPTVMEFDGQTSIVYINTKCNRTNQASSRDVEQFLGHIMMPAL